MFGWFTRSAAAPFIDAKAPIATTEFAVIDTELTGLDDVKDGIISIGAVHMTGGAIGIGDVYYHLVSPGAELTAENVVIHEITPTEVASKPSIGEVLTTFL
ncbi:MAG: exonuclease domain-containing protein, partial [Nitrospiraceae bacterium]|nr:exonuclease domain-containing protein [Nitrospiraceae bacterium]